MGRSPRRRWSARSGRNPLTGLNPLQHEMEGTITAISYAYVAIPLRGSIPCNLSKVGTIPTKTTPKGRNPLTGLNPLQLVLYQAPVEGYEVAIPLRGSIPCNDDLATIWYPPVGYEVAIPLRGSIPCN